MRAGVIGLVCFIWAVLAHQQVSVWASDVTLWHHAALVEPTSAQAHANLAAAYLEQHWFALATAEDLRALALGTGTRYESEVRRVIARQLRWISIFTAVCLQPRWSQACAFS